MCITVNVSPKKHGFSFYGMDRETCALSILLQTSTDNIGDDYVTFEQINAMLKKWYRIDLKPGKDGIAIRIAYWKYNAAEKRLNSVGTAEVLVTGLHEMMTQYITLHTVATGKVTDTRFKLHGVALDVSHATCVREYAVRSCSMVNNTAFLDELAEWEMSNVGEVSNYMHWYTIDACATSVHNTADGQPCIDAYCGTEGTIARWWNEAIALASAIMLKPPVPSVDVTLSELELDALGVSALFMLVGPYTATVDAIDTRNTKWASYHGTGDCDKDALTGCALYTLIVGSTDSVKKMLSERAKAVVEQWQKYRGQAIMAHVNITPQGPHRLASVGASPLGHSIMGILSKAAAARPLETALQVDNNILFAEMTGLVTPHVKIAGKSPCEDDYPNIRFDGDERGGYGGMILFNAAQYPKIFQVYSSTECVNIELAEHAHRPSVSDTFSSNTAAHAMPPLSQVLGVAKKEGIDAATAPSRVRRTDELQLIDIITPDTSTTFKVGADVSSYRLCNPRGSTFTTLTRDMSDPSTAIYCVGPSKFGVLKYDSDGRPTPATVVKVPKSKTEFIDLGRPRVLIHSSR